MKNKTKRMNDMELENISGGSALECLRLLDRIRTMGILSVQTRTADNNGNLLLENAAGAAVELSGILKKYKIGHKLYYDPAAETPGNVYYIKEKGKKVFQSEDAIINIIGRSHRISLD